MNNACTFRHIAHCKSGSCGGGSSREGSSREGSSRDGCSRDDSSDDDSSWGSSDKDLWRIEQPVDIESGRMGLMERCKSSRQEQCAQVKGGPSSHVIQPGTCLSTLLHSL